MDSMIQPRDGGMDTSKPSLPVDILRGCCNQLRVQEAAGISTGPCNDPGPDMDPIGDDEDLLMPGLPGDALRGSCSQLPTPSQASAPTCPKISNNFEHAQPHFSAIANFCLNQPLKAQDFTSLRRRDIINSATMSTQAVCTRPTALLLAQSLALLCER